MKKSIFDEHSVINENTDLESFIPPNPGWNYVSLKKHPEDFYVNSYCGKWLLFVPTNEFVETFRELAKLAKEFKLTHAFKASGRPENGTHVFCIYCGNYKEIEFVGKIAKTLLEEGFVDRFGYKYRSGSKAIFFKTDETTHYKSDSKGESLSLFKFHDDYSFFVKKFFNGKPSWEQITSLDSEIVDSFEEHLSFLSMGDIDFDDF